MTEEKYTPTTEEVRARYAADEFGYSAAPDDPCPEFDRWLAEHDAEAAKAERERAINLLKTIVKEAGDAHGERQMYRADDVLECINLIQRDSMPEDSHCDCCD
jgi:hypothetical protein